MLLFMSLKSLSEVVRVIFCEFFSGRMVVFLGGKASGFKNVHDHDTYDADGTRLFRVFYSLIFFFCKYFVGCLSNWLE